MENNGQNKWIHECMTQTRCERAVCWWVRFGLWLIQQAGLKVSYDYPKLRKWKYLESDDKRHAVSGNWMIWCPFRLQLPKYNIHQVWIKAYFCASIVINAAVSEYARAKTNHYCFVVISHFRAYIKSSSAVHRILQAMESRVGYMDHINSEAVRFDAHVWNIYGQFIPYIRANWRRESL